jgi:hypothetical protein
MFVILIPQTVHDVNSGFAERIRSAFPCGIFTIAITKNVHCNLRHCLAKNLKLFRIGLLYQFKHRFKFRFIHTNILALASVL